MANSSVIENARSANSVESENVGIALNWLALLPAMGVLAFALYVVAPRLSSKVDLREINTLFIGYWAPLCLPEPIELIRYILAISLVPITLWASFMGLRRFSSRIKGRVTQWIVIRAAVVVEIFVIAFCVPNFLAKDNCLLPYLGWGVGLFVLFSILAIGLERWRTGKFRTALESKAGAMVLFAVAALYTIVRLLPTLVTDPEKWSAGPASHLPYTMSEFAAVLNGGVILCGYVPEYQKLSEYFLVPVFKLVDLSPISFSLTMGVMSAVALSLIYWCLRIACRSNIGAFALYMLFLLLSFAPMDSTLTYNAFDYFAAFPLRYFGPVVVLALTVYYMLRPNGLRRLLLFTFAWLTALNNLDFGVPALGAAFLTLGLNDYSRAKKAPHTLISDVAILAISGCALSAIYAGLGFAFSNRFPDFKELVEYQSIFVKFGYLFSPLPHEGLYVLLYLTFMACIYLALIKFFNRHQARNQISQSELVRAGMLLFAGIFGSGALAYYIGRSFPQVLIRIIPAWSLALSMLWLEGYINLRAFLVRSGSGGDDSSSNRKMLSSSRFVLRFAPAIVLSILAALSLGNLVTTPNPITELKRVSDGGANYRAQIRELAQYVKTEAAPMPETGSIGIIHEYGDIVASAAGFKNDFPYTIPRSLILRRQLDNTVTVFRNKGTRDVFLCPEPDGITRELRFELSHSGYRPYGRSFQPNTTHLGGGLEHWRKPDLNPQAVIPSGF